MVKEGSHHPRYLFIVHGFGEHGGRYQHWPHYLSDTVDRIAASDLRGHGRSQGTRGYVSRFDDFADDMMSLYQEFESRVSQVQPNPQIHLLGHSLGGLIVLRMLLAHKNLNPQSVILSAPLLKLRAKVPLAKQLAGYALSRVWGSLQMDAPVDEAILSRDPEVGKAYVEDELVHIKGTPRFFTELQTTLADTLERSSELQRPMMVIAPLQDELVDSDQTLRFFDSLSMEDRSLRTYEGFYHESFNEIGKERVFGDLKQWILKQDSLG